MDMNNQKFILPPVFYFIIFFLIKKKVNNFLGFINKFQFLQPDKDKKNVFTD